MGGYKWPKEAEERPLVQRFDGKVATFKDGSTAEEDVVMMCTGYLHSYPFLREDLRMKSRNLLYPAGMYKGMVWTAGNLAVVVVLVLDVLLLLMFFFLVLLFFLLLKSLLLLN